MIIIIDYGLGNIGSVANALEKLNTDYQVSNDLSLLKKADMLIMPGVGSAGQGMKNLRKRKLDMVIVKEINKGKPFLGICLGMQLLFEYSEEGNVKCLGVLKGAVKKFKKMRKVPQIGWNKVKINNLKFKKKDDRTSLKIIFNNIPDKSYFYFVNSYYCLPDDNSVITGESEYGERFASIIVKNNIVATQFHPEKSGQVGYQILNNLIRSYYVD